MDGKRRKAISDIAQNAQVLYDNAVQSRLIKGKQKIIQSIQLFLLYKCVDCKINLSAEKMRHVEPRKYFILCKVVCVCSGPVKLSAKVNGVCAGVYSSLQSFIISGRG